jgi:hypothetical protein
MIFRRFRTRRPPDGYDELGVPFWHLRPVRHPRLQRAVRGLDRAYGLVYRGSSVFALPVAFVSPWLIPTGIPAFEAMVIVLFQRSSRRNASRRLVPPN